MKHAQIVLALALVLIIAAACGLSEADMAQTSEAISGTANAQGTSTAKVKETETAVTQQYITEEAATAQAATATEIAGLTATADQATRQANAQETLQAQTQIAVAQATEQASRIYDVVQTLYDGGYITTTDGYFQDLPEYDATWAQIGYFTLEPIRDSFVKDFVLVVDVTWEASDKATEFYRSGCGIAFRINDEGSEYYVFFLSFDGKMNFFQLENNSGVLSKKNWGKVEAMADSATFIITVEGINFQVFNDQFERKDLRNGAALEDGYLAFMLASGSNRDFGTHCDFTNVDLWRIGE